MAGFVALYVRATETLNDGQHPFPVIQPSNAVLAYVALCSGMVLFVYARASTDESAAKPVFRYNTLIRLTFILLLLFGVIFGSLQPQLAKVHPIDLLIFRARIQHNDYVSQARTSTTLEEAVNEYQRRYKYPPPP